LRDNASFLAWLLDTIEERGADALVVAGDVFDSANPPASAQHLFYRFLADARRRFPALDLVIIAGNHDSAGRLEAPRPLLDGFGIHLVGALARGADGRHLSRRGLPAGLSGAGPGPAVKRVIEKAYRGLEGDPASRAGLQAALLRALPLAVSTGPQRAE
jgi:exonuclease SbcD